jgi:hypothetical protein
LGRVAVIGGTSETWLVGLLSRSWEIPTVNDDARGQRSANMVFAGVETSNEFIIQGPLANGLVSIWKSKAFSQRRKRTILRYEFFV